MDAINVQILKLNAKFTEDVLSIRSSCYIFHTSWVPTSLRLICSGCKKHSGKKYSGKWQATLIYDAVLLSFVDRAIATIFLKKLRIENKDARGTVSVKRPNKGEKVLKYYYWSLSTLTGVNERNSNGCMVEKWLKWRWSSIHGCTSRFGTQLYITDELKKLCGCSSAVLQYLIYQRRQIFGWQ